MFIDLHKDKDVKESINYKDKFIDERYFQWQTPNNTSQNTDRGQNIINNIRRGIKLYLFVRKYREIDGRNEPFIYIGTGDTVHFEGEKPITVKIKLENEIPSTLFTEFTKKV